jgi:hypothetical protein
MSFDWRFWSKVLIDDDCWEWQACRDAFGYGRFRGAGPRRFVHHAHRYAFEQHHGAVPDGLFVCHRCDNPSCVRPDHLFAGTHSDNMADCRAKLRNNIGARNGQSKLTDDEVRQIRAIRGESQQSIARRFGITQTVVSGIRRRATWRHVA